MLFIANMGILLFKHTASYTVPRAWLPVPSEDSPARAPPAAATQPTEVTWTSAWSTARCPAWTSSGSRGTNAWIQIDQSTPDSLFWWSFMEESDSGAVQRGGRGGWEKEGGACRSAIRASKVRSGLSPKQNLCAPERARGASPARSCSGDCAAKLRTIMFAG